MTTLGPLGFLVPGLLLGLLALPLLWLLLRAVPPAPARKRFAAVTLLLRLRDEETTPARTPWWLLALRILAAAALIVGFAGPVLNPVERAPGGGPLLILADGSWASARDWTGRADKIASLLDEAGRDGRRVAVAMATDLPPEGAVFRDASDWAQRLPGLSPRPWEPEPEALAAWVAALPAGIDTYWLSDGLDRPGREGVRAELARRGDLRIFESAAPLVAIEHLGDSDGRISVGARRLRADVAGSAEIVAIGTDPAGTERPLARASLDFAPGEAQASAEIALPTELRNRITRFSVAGQRSAAGVWLADDGLARRKVALVAGREESEAQDLLSPLHFLRRALAPSADLIEAGIADALLATPDVLIMADVATLTEGETARLVAWVERGGTLVRFAGPRLAASDVARNVEDPLLPVRLRSGGRTVGGALSWGEPRRLRAFDLASPFYGLPVPDDVEVRAQVVAQPDPLLAERAIATLEDGTPLVTRKALGQGRVILFHVTANAEWSSLPLSGLFVQMLERLAISARSGLADLAALEDDQARIWTAARVLDAFGEPRDAGTLAGVAGARLAALRPGPDAPPGLYTAGERRVAVNVMSGGHDLSPAVWPAGQAVEGLETAPERRLGGLVLSVALVILMADILAALAISGRLGDWRRPGARAAVMGLGVVILAAFGPAPSARADFLPLDESRAVEATSETVLAYVLTGD
ncbi:MAG: BatA domain-containing protein, partial [Rhodobacteraceae bacterium]|nr:BatA domain-containing protein [Paracoccaceae bacterium]